MGKRVKRELMRPVMLIIGIALTLAGIAALIWVERERASFGVLEESILIQIPADELPDDTLYITEERRRYARGTMTLIIPSIGVHTPVGDSTLPAGLEEMPGLYEFSQLPWPGDVNVSIAGHRDIHDQVFLDADKITENDYAYLLYKGVEYRYIYKDTSIVKPDYWDAIKPQGFSCLTLTTCDPVGTAINRMIVRFELIDAVPFE